MLGRTSAIAFFAFTLFACHTYRDQLARSEKAFDASDNERTLAILRDLEPDFQRLTPAEQATYAYLRGMTDYNVGYKVDARHWLAVASAYEQATPGALPGERKAKTAAVLKELNDVVYMKGLDELTNAAPPAPAASSAAPASPKKEKPKAAVVDAGSAQD